MLYSGIITVFSEVHINTLCGQNVEFLNSKSGSKNGKHWTLKGHAVSDDPHSVGTVEAGMSPLMKSAAN